MSQEILGMMTAVRRTFTDEELTEAKVEVERHWDRVGESIEAGLAASGAKGDTRGVAALASLIFSDHVVHEFDEEAAFWCRYLVEVFSGSPMIVKMLNAYQLELDVTDSVDIVDGPLGKAIDDAVAVLRPLARARKGSPWED